MSSFVPPSSPFPPEHVYSLLVSTVDPPPSVSTILDRIALYPDEAAAINTTSTRWMIPLQTHRAIMSLEIIQALLKAYPEGIRFQDKLYGRYPIFYAVIFNAPPENIMFLHQLAPDFASVRGMNDWTLLHFACMVKSFPLALSLTTMRCALYLYPDNIKVLDRWDQLPLKHLVEGIYPPQESVLFLMDAYPEAIKVEDSWGQSILHQALVGRHTLEVIRRIYESNPEALHKRTKKNVLPLSSEFAFSVQTVDETILGENFPTVEERDQQRIKWKWNDPQIIKFLVDCAIGSVLISSSVTVTETSNYLAPGTTAAESWINLVSDSADIYVEVVESFLDAHAMNIAQLAYTTDLHGRRALDIATPKCKSAILRRLYLCGRYAVVDGPPEHASATSLVYRALDYAEMDGGPLPLGKKPMPVVLKFMKNWEEYKSEINMRNVMIENQSSHDSVSSVTKSVMEDYILPILRTHDVVTDPTFAGQLKAQVYDTYSHLVVMQAGDKSLAAVIDTERLTLRWNIETVRAIREITEALQFLHGSHIIHGDIKPRNILRVNTHYKLIDMDAALNMGDVMMGEYTDFNRYKIRKVSTAYAAPELLREIRSKAFVLSGQSNRTDSSVASSDWLRAWSAIDMWGLGVVLYSMLRGASLVHADTCDNTVYDDDLLRIENWDVHTANAMVLSLSSKSKSKRTIEGNDKFNESETKYACHLLSLLLHPDPLKRPSARVVLTHPFLTGKPAVRLTEEKAEWDVFLSYRVASDNEIAAELYQTLTDEGLRVWWDRVRLPLAQGWQDAFAEGLITSRLFIPIFSKESIASPSDSRRNWSKLTALSDCDNVLLENRIALEAHARGLIEFIFPIFVGETQTIDQGNARTAGAATADTAAESPINTCAATYTPNSKDLVPVLENAPSHNRVHSGFDFSTLSIPTDVPVVSVDKAIQRLLDVHGLGVPLLDMDTLSTPLAVWKGITSFQGTTLRGERTVAIKNLAKQIVHILEGK